MNDITPQPQSLLVRQPRRTQEERRSSSEQALVKAAIEVMKHKGMAGLTLAEVAAKAGVSKGLVVHLYANKQGLQLAALAKVRKDFMRRFERTRRQAGVHEQGLDLIRRYIRGIFENLSNRGSNSLLFSALLSEALFQEQAFAEQVAIINNATQQFVHSCLMQELARGARLMTEDVDALATFIVAWVRGVVQVYAINDVAGTQAVSLPAMLALMERMLDTLVQGETAGASAMAAEA